VGSFRSTPRLSAGIRPKVGLHGKSVAKRSVMPNGLIGRQNMLKQTGGRGPERAGAMQIPHNPAIISKWLPKSPARTYGKACPENLLSCRLLPLHNNRTCAGRAANNSGSRNFIG
jgi:hypothetical protein